LGKRDTEGGGGRERESPNPNFQNYPDSSSPDTFLDGPLGPLWSKYVANMAFSFLVNRWRWVPNLFQFIYLPS